MALSEYTIFHPQLQRFVKVVEDNTSSAVQYVGVNKDPGATFGSQTWLLYRWVTTGTIREQQWAIDTAGRAQSTFTFQFSNRSSLFAGASFFNQFSTSYNGVDETTHAGNTFNYDNATAWSFDLWVKPNNFAAQRTIYSKATNDANVFGYILYVNTSGNLFLQMRASAQLRSHTFGITLTVADWNHVAFTYSGGQNINGARCYVNGTVDSTPSSGAVTNTLLAGQTAYFGSRNNALYWSGYLDEPHVWNKELSAAEVTEIYNSGAPFDPADASCAANLVSNWRMGDGDSYPTILDQSGSNPLTMVNMDGGNFATDVP